MVYMVRSYLCKHKSKYIELSALDISGEQGGEKRGREKFTALNTYIRKQENMRVSKPNIYLRN